MKGSIVILFLIIPFLSFGQNDTITLEGVYYNKNLYWAPPIDKPLGSGFCVKYILINGKQAEDKITITSFEIDLDYYVSVGDSVTVQIIHLTDCTPKVLNPSVLSPISTFEISEIAVDTNGVLYWKTKNEQGVLPFIIEQFRWNMWIKVGEVNGKGSKEANEYTYQTVPHSGINTFRLKQIDYIRKRYSESVEFKSTVPKITFTPKRKVKTEITFSNKTQFQLVDWNGNILKKGYKKIINCSDLEKGAYVLYFDNEAARFIK